MEKAPYGFDLVVVGYTTSREVRVLEMIFAARSGATLTPSRFTVDIQTVSSAWFNDARSAALGSQFQLRQPIIVDGSLDDVGSVVVILVSDEGQSESFTGP